MPKSKLAIIGRTNSIKVEIPNFMNPRYPEGSFKHYVVGEKEKGKTLKPCNIHTKLELTYILGGYQFYITVLVALDLEDSKINLTSYGDHDGLLLIDLEKDLESPNYGAKGYAAHIYAKNEKGKYVYKEIKEARVLCDKKEKLKSF